MRIAAIALLLLACSACASTPPSAPAPAASAATPEPTSPPLVAIHSKSAIIAPPNVTQGALLFGYAPPGSVIVYAGRHVRVAHDSRFVIGVAREQTGMVTLKITKPDGSDASVNVTIVPRSFPVERVEGVPEKTVNPPPDIAARIEREQADVEAVRTRDDDRTDFEMQFIWPVKGRISGVFGSQRIYNGTPKSAHSGVDVAAKMGTPIHAPAGGIVSFANPDLYLTGGTALIDHGHGVSSNFLHMSRIYVKVGDRVEQGQVIGLVGATGRANGPHMHWGMNWFDVRVDPLLLMTPPGQPAPTEAK